MEILGPIAFIAVFFAAMAPIVFVVCYLQFGKRVFTRAFWRPAPNFGYPPDLSRPARSLGNGIVGFIRGTALVIFWLLRAALGIAIVGAVLYAVVWVLHTLWRAT